MLKKFILAIMLFVSSSIYALTYNEGNVLIKFFEDFNYSITLMSVNEIRSKYDLIIYNNNENINEFESLTYFYVSLDIISRFPDFFPEYKGFRLVTSKKEIYFSKEEFNYLIGLNSQEKKIFIDNYLRKYYATQQTKK